MTKEEYFEQAVNALETNLDQAIDLYRKALELDPNYQDALHGLGFLALRAGLGHGRDVGQRSDAFGAGDAERTQLAALDLRRDVR